MTQDATAIDLTKRASFNNWVSVSLRFSDMDSLGHVNNVAIAAFVEVCRTNLIHRFLLRDTYPHLNFALVHIDIDYRSEFQYPGTVDVGGRLERIGTKSFSTSYGLFVDDLCVATAGSVNVFFDLEKREGVRPPDEIRALMQEIYEAQPG